MAKKLSRLLYLGTENGKEIRKRITADTLRELNAKENKLKAEYNAGRDVMSTPLFGVWADKWYNAQCSDICKGTATMYQSAITHLNNRFERVDMREIGLDDVQSLINDLARENPNTKKPTAKATLENINKVCGKIFHYAHSCKVAGVDDFHRDIKIPKTAPENKRRALTPEEIQRIIETPHRAQIIAMIMTFAGLRDSEVVALKWRNVNLTRGYIKVCESAPFYDNRASEKQGGKTENATRIVPLPKILVDFLREYKESEKILSQYVCTTQKGEQLTKSGWRRIWESYMRELNLKYGLKGSYSKYTPKALPMLIEPFTPYYCRHTFATLCFLEDLPITTAKQICGHADIQTTINIYADLKNYSKADLPESFRNRLSSDFHIPEMLTA